MIIKMKVTPDRAKKQMSDFLDTRLALPGYADYIEANLGEALDVFAAGNDLYDLDDRVALKKALGMYVPAFVCSGIHALTDDSLTELSDDEIRELFRQYVLETGRTGPRPRKDAIHTDTPAGILSAVKRNGRITVTLNNPDGDEEDTVLVSVDGNTACLYDADGVFGTEYRFADGGKLTYNGLCKDADEYRRFAARCTKETKKETDPVLADTKAFFTDLFAPEDASPEATILIHRCPGEAAEVFGNGGGTGEFIETIALECALGMFIPYWLYLYMKTIASGADFVTAQAPEDITYVFQWIVNWITEGNVDGLNAFMAGNTIYAGITNGVLKAYASTDPEYPGIFIDRIDCDSDGLYDVSRSLTEYNPADGGSIDTHLCTSLDTDDYTVFHQHIGQAEIEERKK